jgi:hypothetical protein
MKYYLKKIPVRQVDDWLELRGQARRHGTGCARGI